MSAPTLLQLRVRALTWEAEDVLGVELVPAAPNRLLPAAEAGAHLDLHLPGELQRSYSLLNEPGERRRYCIAVRKDAASRGGSRWVHEALRPGMLLTVSAPRNNFALAEGTPQSVFIAGGIGITPILSMVRRLSAIGRPWQLHYAARTRASAPFLEALQALADKGAGRLETWFTREAGSRRLDVATVVRSLPEAAHVYCCGPLPMLDAFEAATSGLAPERVHVEHFAAREAAATGGGFRVTLRRRGRSIEVQPGQTILDSLIAAGIEPPWSCREGVCGTCETRVLAGIPDHRDLVLSAAEHAANDRMMVCCSGARSAELVLDL